MWVEGRTTVGSCHQARTIRTRVSRYFSLEVLLCALSYQHPHIFSPASQVDRPAASRVDHMNITLIICNYQTRSDPLANFKLKTSRQQKDRTRAIASTPVLRHLESSTSSDVHATPNRLAADEGSRLSKLKIQVRCSQMRKQYNICEGYNIQVLKTSVFPFSLTSRACPRRKSGVAKTTAVLHDSLPTVMFCSCGQSRCCKQRDDASMPSSVGVASPRHILSSQLDIHFVCWMFKHLIYIPNLLGRIAHSPFVTPVLTPEALVEPRCYTPASVTLP